MFTPAGSQCAHLLLDTAVDAINYYRQRFGFFPYRSLTIIPGADEPYGGYPASTALVVVHGQEKFDKKPKDFWRWITAHEVGHQYWSEYVLSRDTEDIGWLMIGLGIYADREYSRTHGMPTRHENFFEQYANGVRRGVDTTIERTPEQYREIDWDYNNIVMHSKGFSVISALAAMLGTETFDRIYTRCLREYAGRRLGWQTFESIAEQESGIDLQPFFDQWVRSSRYPAYQITDTTSHPTANGRYVTEVRVEQMATLSMPVPVGAEFADGSHQIKFTDGDSRISVVIFDSASALKAATLDPNHEIAMVVPLPPMTAQDMAIRIDDMSEADDAVALKLSNQIGTLAINPSRLRKLILALYNGQNYESALQLTRKFETEQHDSDYVPAAQALEAVLLDLMGKRNEALDLYRQIKERIGTNRYQYYEIGLVVDKQFIDERLKTPYHK